MEWCTSSSPRAVQRWDPPDARSLRSWAGSSSRAGIGLVSTSAAAFSGGRSSGRCVVTAAVVALPAGTPRAHGVASGPGGPAQAAKVAYARPGRLRGRLRSVCKAASGRAVRSRDESHSRGCPSGPGRPAAVASSTSLGRAARPVVEGCTSHPAPAIPAGAALLPRMGKPAGARNDREVDPRSPLPKSTGLRCSSFSASSAGRKTPPS